MNTTNSKEVASSAISINGNAGLRYVQVAGSSFTRNRGTLGAAVHLTGMNYAQLAGNTFTSNHASSKGGAIYAR